MQNEWLSGRSRAKLGNIDKFSRPYMRLLREPLGGNMYNTLSEHRRFCGCDRCNKARARHEAIGAMVETIVLASFEDSNHISRRAANENFCDRLDALAEILKRRPFTE